MRRGVRPRHCLDVEDADGAAVNAEGSGTLRLLAAAMEASRRGGERDQEEAKRRYLEFVRRKKGRKESKARREALVDLCCSTASAAVVLSYLSPRSRFGDRHLPAGRPEGRRLLDAELQCKGFSLFLHALIYSFLISAR